MTSIVQPGIYPVDKPSGPSSHTIVNYFRRQSKIKRVGHTGTLDPLASGLLIILVGREYTRLQDTYLKQDKEYLVNAQLGWISDTYDCTGTIQEHIGWEKLDTITKEKVTALLPHFLGVITQIVPPYSAVKINGQKLYDKARLGQVIDLPSRQVTLHTIELLDYQRNDAHKTMHIRLRVACSSGTYIRSLIHDIGQKLGVGALVTELRRTKIGQLDVQDADKLEEFKWTKNPPSKEVLGKMISQSD